MKSWYVLCIFLLSGCSLVTWNPFGTPASRAQKSEQRVNYIKADLLDLVQADVHRIVLALQDAPPSLEVSVALDFAQHATTLMDQSRGAPTSLEISKWHDLTNRLVSDNPETRLAANKQLEAERARGDALSNKLERAQTQHEEDQTKLAQYSAANAQLVTIWRWTKRIVIGAVILWCLAQLLALVAKFYPPAMALSLAANGIMAPLHTIFHIIEARAKTAITK